MAEATWGWTIADSGEHRTIRSGFESFREALEHARRTCLLATVVDVGEVWPAGGRRHVCRFVNTTRHTVGGDDA